LGRYSDAPAPQPGLPCRRRARRARGPGAGHRQADGVAVPVRYHLAHRQPYLRQPREYVDPGYPRTVLAGHADRVVPCLLGVFWGGPLVVRELETGTIQFAWMQSITRGRWLTVKVGWARCCAVPCPRSPSPSASSPSPGNRPGPPLPLPDRAHQDLQLPAPPAIASRVLLAGLGERRWPRRPGNEPGPRRARRFLRRRAVPIGSMPSACRVLVFQNPLKFGSCLAAHGYRAFISYQPASRHWASQGIETGIFAVLATVLVAVTAIVVLRRDA
jgi:hypothetical protein